MSHIVILGGGLAGISAAYHLEEKGFFDYSLFEKEATIGGLCGSIDQDGFTFDYTGHLLHINDPYVYQLVARIIGFEHFNIIARRSYIYSQDCYTAYPYQINLYGLPIKTIAECIQGYIKRHTHIKKPKHFKDWVLKQFGPGFAKHFFLPYQRKIFAYNLEQITASWTGRFVPQTSLEQIIAGSLGQNQDQAIGYNAQFFYPKRGGIFFLVKSLAAHLQRPIYTHKQVEHINLKERTLYFTDGHVQPYSMIINTIPLDQLVTLLTGKSNRFFDRAANKLLCNSVLNFNMGLSRENLSDRHWIYFPERQFPFYRIGFTHNFSAYMTPPGCSSLYGEIAYIKRSKDWKHEKLNQAIKQTKHLLHIQEHEMITEKIYDISHAYVIYNHWREKHLTPLLKALEQEHIYSIGRYGAWKYCSMQETILDGKIIADKLLVIPAITWQPTYHISKKGEEREL